ncbi:protein FAM207A-like [Elysia marginata]|uniref:Protein FAM207A-like n=1 Tax=Elysia marginata TaxID=1093978 RepID=A0AAV4HX39_9GAST|nr:protein FAM207A-like [Elysia marginata]
MDAITSAKKKAKEKKKKQQTPIVGDLTEMEEALPTLELLLKKSTHPAEKHEHNERERSIPKEKKRKKQVQEDISLFHRVSQHPLFKEDASMTIKRHLRNKVQMEKDMET